MAGVHKKVGGAEQRLHLVVPPPPQQRDPAGQFVVTFQVGVHPHPARGLVDQVKRTVDRMIAGDLLQRVLRKQIGDQLSHRCVERRARFAGIVVNKKEPAERKVIS